MILLAMAVSLKRPGVALGFIILMFGLEQFLQTRDAVFVERSNIVNIGIGLLGLVAATGFLFQNFDKLATVNIQIAVIALYAFGWMSQLWTSMPDTAWSFYTSALPYQILFFLLAPILMLGRKEIRVGLRTVFFLGFPLVILFALFVEWSNRGIRLAAPVMIHGRISWDSPTLGLANMAASVGILSIILLPKGLLARLLHAIAFCLAFYIVYRTQSRGQLVALVLVIFTCFPIANRAASLKGMLSTLAGFSIVLGMLIVVFSFLDLGDINRWGEDRVASAVDGRFAMVTSLLGQWANGPPSQLFVGMGASSSFKLFGSYPHNLPTEILGELGLIGFSLYLYIYWLVGVKSFRILGRLNQFPEMRREIVALLAMFLYATLISFKEDTLTSANSVFMFAIMIGHVERHSKKMARESISLKRIYLAPSPSETQKLNFPNQTIHT